MNRLRLLALSALLFAPLQAQTGNTTVDIFVAYTPAARAYAGGVNGMVASINSYIALTNTCYTNSDIAVTLRLVGTAEVNYAESGNFGTDLGRLSNLGDGFMDEVGTLRNTFGADLVALIRRDAAAGVAGIAYIGNATPGFAPYGYSVTADVWASGNLAFPHELGHNFGALHDRANAGGGTTGYNYGWRFYGNNGTQYITVMAYYPGARIPYFSNPSILYQGVPTGVASGPTAADNALLHDTHAAGTAALRSTTTPVGSGVKGDFNGDSRPDLVLWNNATGQRAIWHMNGATRTGISTLPTGTTAWQIVAAADFNADGHTDLVYQNFTTGGRTIWLMRGATRESVIELPIGLIAWRIAAAADFNGDGKTDLIFQNTLNGGRSIWLMDGTTRTSVVDLPAGILAWRIAAAADFNADGHTDLVFENTSTGGHSIWFMNGTVRASIADLPADSTAWKIANR